MFKTKQYTIEDIDKILAQCCKLGKLVSANEGEKLRMILSEDVNSPWYMVRDASRDACAFWGSFINYPGLGKGFSFIPTECRDLCWKVVARPQSLTDLFKMRDIIDEMGPAAKCGIEVRETVCGLYGSYFYNRSLDEGREKYKLVKEKVEERLVPGTPVILKRGCTEYEIGMHGDSREWKPFEGQDEVEEYIKSKIDVLMVQDEQTEFIHKQVFDKWVRWAYTCGDKDYLKYTGGQPLYPAYATYHDEEF